jgi:response regulator RpfG family c-di-GMP phosphodiesterase
MPGHFDPQIMKAFIKNAAEFEEIFNSHQD